MTAITKYFIILVFFIGLLPVFGQAQSVWDTTNVPVNFLPEFSRQIRHDAIDAEQKAVLASDGKADKTFAPTDKEEINFLLTQALIKKVDVAQYLIESDKVFDHRLKVNYLKGLENVLAAFRRGWKLKTERKVNPLNLSAIITAYGQCVDKDRNAESIAPVIAALSYDAGMTVMDAGIFSKNPGYRAAIDAQVFKYCVLYPAKTFQTLRENPNVPFADSLVRTVARKYPRQLYDYAQSSNKLAFIIRNIQDDTFIKTVSQMARSKSGQQYFPFLDNIVNGKLTFAQIDSVKDDSILYYRMLVNTQIDYTARAINKDTAFEYKALSDKIAIRAREIFVTTINGLHDEDEEVRFRIIQPLTAEELYYLAVSTDGEIYTSSFVAGVYPLMMKRINNRGDSLLMSLNFDKYRKFIKMAAGFNTLSSFLASFPNHEDANDLMKAFVSAIEKSDGLEDGADVADSYASIAETLKPVANEMLNNVQRNYQRNLDANNKRGMAIYNILQKLFLSADTSNKIDLTREFNIPPVYEVPFKSLANDSGRVIMQVFFYGDKDGQGIFNGFQNMFNNANWKIDRSNPMWISITSAKGKPVTIYANKALPEETGEDEKAQKALCDYLESKKLYPTVTIHRGHSYYANSTIEHMFSSSRIVFLGSCGGYHLIHDVLETAPDAHIIASKQIGKTAVNRPFFELLTEKIRNGNNIDWIPFWQELEKKVKVEGFEDYIPPYKNLGALFIKAYNIAMGEENEN